MENKVTINMCWNYQLRIQYEHYKGPFTPSVSVNAAMTLAILFSLKTMESLQNGVATHFQATPLFSMKTESQASS